MKTLLMVIGVCLTACGPNPLPAPIVHSDPQDCTPKTVAVGDAFLPNGGLIVTCASGPYISATNGPAYTVQKLSNPCGSQLVYGEAFLLLSTGRLIKSISEDGKNAVLVDLPDGINYSNLSNSWCMFKLETVSGGRLLTWQGGSESWTIN